MNILEIYECLCRYNSSCKQSNNVVFGGYNKDLPET